MPKQPTRARSRIRKSVVGASLLVALCHPLCALGAEPSTALPEPGARLAGGPVIPEVPAVCADTIVDDDGTVETGYGWVPSVVEGIFVQEYSSQELATGTLGVVCVCWLRTRMDDTIDFEVVVYRHDNAEERPFIEPIAAIPAQLSGLPMGIPGATFTAVDLGAVPVPDGPFYVGVRWNASADQFFFACVDKTDRPEPPTRVFFRDDRFPDEEWGVSDDTNDSTFLNHQAMLVRPAQGPSLLTTIDDLPLGEAVHPTLIAAILLAGVLLVRRSRG